MRRGVWAMEHIWFVALSIVVCGAVLGFGAIILNAFAASPVAAGAPEVVTLTGQAVAALNLIAGFLGICALAGTAVFILF